MAHRTGNRPREQRALSHQLPVADTDTDRALLAAVLDGWASETQPPSTGLAADLLQVIAPQHMLRRGSEDGVAFVIPTGHADAGPPATARSAALTRLVRRRAALAQLREAVKFGRGQSGTTSVWGNTARALARGSGRRGSPQRSPSSGPHCLVTCGERAVTSTASGHPSVPRRTTARSSPPFDSSARMRRGGAPPTPSRTTSVAGNMVPSALLSAANAEVVASCLDLLDCNITSLQAERLRPLLEASSRLGASGLVRPLPYALLHPAADKTPTTALLVAHHAAAQDHSDPLHGLSDAALQVMAIFAAASWPAHRALSMRLESEPSPQALAALRASGPQAVVTVGSLSLDLANELLLEVRSFPMAWVPRLKQLDPTHTLFPTSSRRPTAALGSATTDDNACGLGPRT